MHESIQDPLPLHHGDRVVLGRQNNYNFVYVDPREGSGQELIEHGEVSYEDCMEELAAKQGDVSSGYMRRRSVAEAETTERKRQEEYEMSIREAEEARAKADAEAKAREEEYEARLQKCSRRTMI
ncbi:hypothetical protein Pmar_PMAR013206, partial [Perkinsus marinus ATCC 50983]